MKRSMVLGTALLVLAVLVLSSTHVFSQVGLGGISIPIVRDTSETSIEGDPRMIITTFDEKTGLFFKFDTIPFLYFPARTGVQAVLLNALPRPEADSTIGMVIGVSGLISYRDYINLVRKETPYEEQSRKELRQPHLQSSPAIIRWITMKRLGDVVFEKQRRGQNDLLSFVGFIEPEDLHPGINVFVVRAYGMLKQRTDRFIVGKKGKPVFNTWDEPCLINVAGCSAPDSDRLKDRIGLPEPSNGDGGGTGPTGEIAVPPTSAAPVKIQIDANGVATFDRIPPESYRVLYNVYANGTWRNWKKIDIQNRQVSFRLDQLVPRTYMLAIQVIGPNSEMLASAQRTLTVGGR